MDLEKETRRPRLRAASMLFGVVAVSSSAGAATHYALCDRDGAPACGNIGQLGRDAPPPAPPVVVQEPAAPPPITNTTVTYNAPLLAITITTKLVAPADPLQTPSQRPDAHPFEDVIEPVAARPVVDEAGDPAPGNVMVGKGGSRRHH
ncbi:MAG TPA: hypothetical protein VL326_35790 [Kofleriaceae bacterium]|jgi:hypothetical protein|nr:hypothetical protein [Kofleriaceae bacterium]